MDHERESEEIELVNILKVIWRWKVFIIAFPLIAGIVSIVISIFLLNQIVVIKSPDS